MKNVELRGGPRWTRHCRVQVVAGSLYLLIGIAYLFVPKALTHSPALRVAFELLPLHGWAVVYMLIGLFTIVSSLFYVGPRPWGYMAMAALSSAWGSMYVLAVIFEPVPKFLTLISASVWLMLAFVWISVSGFIEPEFVKKRVEERFDHETS